MPKVFFKDQMNQSEISVMLLIQSEIKKAMMMQLPLKTIRLQPPYFRIFEELTKKCLTDEEFEEAAGNYMVKKVYIQRGSMIQKRPSEVEYWPMTIKERNLNREAIGRTALN